MKTVKTVVLLLLILLSQNAMAQCWKDVAAGSEHTLGIKTDGTLWAWGRNHFGQLGDGTTVNKNVPTQIGTDIDWATIDAESYNSMALKTDGSLWCWGNNQGGQVSNGEFGIGIIAAIPTRVGTENDWVKISTGGSRTFAIKNNGTLWGCGYNQEGHLGVGDTTPHYTFIQIGSDTDWLEISAASNQTLAIKANNSLWGWGLNKTGSLAIGTPDTAPVITVPTQTGNNTADWVKVNIGGCCSSKMLKTDGSIWAMGLGASGNLGTGSIEDVNIPTQIGIVNDWKSITTSNHSCAIKNNGSLWTWGSNDVGQMGDGTLVYKTVPTQIGFNNTWLKAIAGYFHTVAITTDGSLYTWGYNNYGQLGDGTFQTRNVPTLIGNSCILNTNGFKTIKSFNTYPNPATNITVVSYVLTEKSKISFTITNNLGQIVYQKNKTSNLDENQEPIDLSNFSSGVYHITLKTTNEQNTIKVIKN